MTWVVDRQDLLSVCDRVVETGLGHFLSVTWVVETGLGHFLSVTWVVETGLGHFLSVLPMGHRQIGPSHFLYCDMGSQRQD